MVYGVSNVGGYVGCIGESDYRVKIVRPSSEGIQYTQEVFFGPRPKWREAMHELWWSRAVRDVAHAKTSRECLHTLVDLACSIVLCVSSARERTFHLDHIASYYQYIESFLHCHTPNERILYWEADRQQLLLPGLAGVAVASIESLVEKNMVIVRELAALGGVAEGFVSRDCQTSTS
jgi:hypothetical protein